MLGAQVPSGSDLDDGLRARGFLDGPAWDALRRNLDSKTQSLDGRLHELLREKPIQSWVLLSDLQHGHLEAAVAAAERGEWQAMLQAHQMARRAGNLKQDIEAKLVVKY